MKHSQRDVRMMRECLRLAELGKGRVSPNPLVGAVAARSGRVLSRGFHRFFGGPHAEIECFRRSRHPLLGATLYVNLEPCAHHGKTPPCTDAILRAGIRRVVIGMKDPNPLVNGRGIRLLRQAGVQVQVGVLQQEARHLNRAFIKHMTTGLPYVHVKVAQSIDGKIGIPGVRRFWITSTRSQALVHQWRSEYDAVLVGAGTILADDPLLAVRRVHGRDPNVVILDGRMRVPPSARVFRSARRRRVLLCVDEFVARRKPRTVAALRGRGVTVIRLPGQKGSFSPLVMLKALAHLDIASLLVEGGSKVFAEFVRHRLADEVSVFIGPIMLPGGVAAFQGVPSFTHPLRLQRLWAEQVGEDILIRGFTKSTG